MDLVSRMIAAVGPLAVVLCPAADTALKKPPSEGGDGTTAQPDAAVRPDVAVESDAAAGTAPSRIAPAAVTIVANPVRA